MSDQTTITGTVKFFNQLKGFGFICHDDSKDETFVHVTGLKEKIKDNDRVEFELQQGKTDLIAVNVRKLKVPA